MFVDKLKAVLRPIEAQDNIQQLSVQASEIGSQLSRLSHSRQAKAEAVDDIKAKLDRRAYVALTPDARQAQREREQDLQAQLAQAEDVLKQHDLDYKSLEKEHAETLHQIKKLRANQNQTVSVTSRDLNAHVKAITAAAAEVERIQRLIDRQREIIQAGTDNDLQTALNERQTVLADLAEDKASNADLAAIDKRIDQIRADMAQQQQQASIAQDTINGLQPRLAGAETKHASLTEQYTHLKAHHLMSEMDAVSKRYNEAAQQLMQCYTEYDALHKTLKALPGYRDKRGQGLAPNISAIDGSGNRLPGFDEALHEKLLSSIARRVPML